MWASQVEGTDAIIWLLHPSVNSPWEEGTNPTARTEPGVRQSVQEGKQELDQGGVNSRNIIPGLPGQNMLKDTHRAQELKGANGII